MKSQHILLALAAAIVLFGGIFMLTKHSELSEKKADSETISPLPYTEIVRGKLFSLASDEKTKIKEIKNGEDIADGTILGTDPSSKANIHFPDGSVLRLDENTRVTITKSSYDGKSGKLSAQITLLWGNVWSKIIGLATPDSLWEVTTPHAVATVRGTAFGTSYLKGKTKFIGGEHTVGVQVKDPKTKQLLPTKPLTFQENESLEITDNQTAEITLALTQGTSTAEQKASSLIIVKGASKADLSASWVTEAKDEDAALDTLIKLETKTETRIEILQELREKIELNSDKASTDTRTEVKTEETTTEVKPIIPIKTEATPILKQAEQILIPENAKLIITAITKEQTLEGDTIQFTAHLTNPEGARKTLTTGVIWSTSGIIGSISASGLFTAKLHEQVSEIGEASGTVKASWKDPVSGKVFEAESARFVVSAPPPNETEGQAI